MIVYSCKYDRGDRTEPSEQGGHGLSFDKVTIKDLDPQDLAQTIRGGIIAPTQSCSC
jgi:hypothetical protein